MLLVVHTFDLKDIETNAALVFEDGVMEVWGFPVINYLIVDMDLTSKETPASSEAVISSPAESLSPPSHQKQSPVENDKFLKTDHSSSSDSDSESATDLFTSVPHDSKLNPKPPGDVVHKIAADDSPINEKTLPLDSQPSTSRTGARSNLEALFNSFSSIERFSPAYTSSEPPAPSEPRVKVMPATSPPPNVGKYFSIGKYDFN